MHTYSRALIAVVLILVIGVLAGCQAVVTPQPTAVPTPAIPPTAVPPPQAPPTDTPAPQASPTAEPTQEPPADIELIRADCQAQTDKGLQMQEVVPKGLELPPFKGLMYVPRQIIVGGDPAGISKIEPSVKFQLKPVGEPTLIKDGALALYEVIGSSVEQAVCELNAISAAQKLNLFTDPNYYVSPAPGWSGGGSPWTQNGSWVGRIRGGGFGPVLAANPGRWFLNQWAFRDNGIQLFDASGIRLSQWLGKGTIVAVFDTSPFSEIKGQGTVPFDQLFGDTLGADATGSPDLIVVDRGLTPHPGCPGTSKVTKSNLELQDISNHGLFVAGLVHAVAPQSQIYLIRVLENDGCGDLYTIEQNLSRFMNEIGPEAMKQAVINLSLGVHAPEDSTTLGLPKDVLTLQAVVSQTIEQGAVVVAASGNDSYEGRSALPSEMPAGDANVIGVAASTLQQSRSCFSNAGKVAAPGGDGVDGTTGTCSIPATPKVSICQTQPQYCVISLGRNQKTLEPEYIYWAGTSFATPMVSGQAALLREKEPKWTPAQVADAIYGTAAATSSPGADGIASGIADVKASSR